MNLDVDFESPTALTEPSASEPQVGKSGIWLIFSSLVMVLVFVGFVIWLIGNGGLNKESAVTHVTPVSALVSNLPQRIVSSNGYITICLTDEEEVWLRNGALKINVKSRSEPK